TGHTGNLVAGTDAVPEPERGHRRVVQLAGEDRQPIGQPRLTHVHNASVVQVFSYLRGLECSSCGQSAEVGRPQTVCFACGKVLFARYDLSRARREIDRDALSSRGPSLWRYHELLPVVDP